MDREKFVQNIKFFCARRNVKPTVACVESGAGKNFINHLVRQGSEPSVGKVQLLAEYLGVTTSELLGETLPDDSIDEDLSPEEHQLLAAYRRADERTRTMVQLALEPFTKRKDDQRGLIIREDVNF